MEFTSSVIDLIRKRRSVRSYRNEKLAPETITIIEKILQSSSSGPFGNQVRFRLVEKSWARESAGVKLGTYGFITGAGYFIAGEVKPHDNCFEDYGFLLETIMLHLTDLNLGTCWLGGTFKRSDFAEVLGTDQDLIIPAITPVGFAADKKSIRESIIRWGAKSDNRKGWKELFFENDFSTPLTETSAGKFQLPLEMLRLAPSASNKQPWRIVKTDGFFHFYLKRTPGYGKFDGMDLQKIDMGIAMAHFELSCDSQQLKGTWTTHNPGIPDQNAEYIISWQIVAG